MRGPDPAVAACCIATDTGSPPAGWVAPGDTREGATGQVQPFWLQQRQRRWACFLCCCHGAWCGAIPPLAVSPSSRRAMQRKLPLPGGITIRRQPAIASSMRILLGFRHGDCRP